MALYVQCSSFMDVRFYGSVFMAICRGSVMCMTVSVRGCLYGPVRITFQPYGCTFLWVCFYDCVSLWFCHMHDCICKALSVQTCTYNVLDLWMYFLWLFFMALYRCGSVICMTISVRRCLHGPVCLVFQLYGCMFYSCMSFWLCHMALCRSMCVVLALRLCLDGSVLVLYCS